MRVIEGQHAIKFQARDIYNNRIALDDFSAHPLYLCFFRYASCPFCNLRFSELITKYPRLHSEYNLQILAFFQSPKELISKYVEKRQGNIPFPVIPDPNHEVYRLYGVYASKWGYIRGYFRWGKFLRAIKRGFHLGIMDGIRTLIPASFLIDQGIVVKAYYGSDITDHLPLSAIHEYFLGTS
ncbi:MAG: redoxin domain-containing protein [Candidatus Thorarchaeota archaeon]